MTNPQNTFTGIYDVDRCILLNLELKDLINVCYSSKYTKELCNDNFWENKLFKDFPGYKHKIYESSKNAYIFASSPILQLNST